MMTPTPQRHMPNWAYKWENSTVYVSADGGLTWKLFMYFPRGDTPKAARG